MRSKRDFFEKRESAYKRFRRVFEQDVESNIIDADKFADPAFCRENFKTNRELIRKVDETKDLHEQIDIDGKQRFAMKLIDIGNEKYAVSNSIYDLQVELYDEYVKTLRN